MSEENIFDFLEDLPEDDILPTSEFSRAEEEEDLFEFDADFDLETAEPEEQLPTEVIAEVVEQQSNKALYDTLYVYGKAWKEEAKAYSDNQRQRIEIESYFKDKNSTEKTAISKAFNSCIAPIISEMGERGLFETDVQMREECNALFSHLLLTTIESINMSEGKKPSDYMGKWGQYLVRDSDKLRFKGGLLLLPPIIMKISPEEAWSIFNSYVANLEDSNKVRKKVPDDLAELISRQSKYITKSAKSKPAFGGFQTLSITNTDGYVRNSDLDVLEKFKIADLLQVNNEGLVVAQCECGNSVDMTPSIAVIMKSGKVKNSDSMYFRLRPCVCTECGREILIDYELLKPIAIALCEDLGREAKANNSMTTAYMNYSTLFTVISETKEFNKISLEVMQNDDTTSGKAQFKQGLMEYLNSQKEIKASISNYKTEASVVLLAKNGFRCDIRYIISYIFCRLEPSEREEVIKYARKNIVQFQKYVDYSVAREIMTLKEENPSVLAEFVSNGDKILNIKKVSKVLEPYTEFTSDKKEIITERVRSILNDAIDVEAYLHCSVDKNFEELMHYSRVGPLIEDLLFTDKKLLEDFISSLLGALVTNMCSTSDRTYINLPQRVRVLLQEKKLLVRYFNEMGCLDVDYLFKVLNHDIISFKPVAYKEYRLIMKPVFKYYKPKTKVVLNGVIGEEAEYLLQLKSTNKIISEFISIDDTDDSGRSAKKDTSLSLEPRNILLLAIIRAFDKDRWENPDMYLELTEKFDEVL